MNKTKIPLSKTKLLLGIGGSIVFVALGIYFITTIADQQTRFNPTMIKSVGIASVLFFGATGIYGIMKMFDKTIGLTIDDNGIFDNTNASSVGLIKWTDITEIKTEQVASTKFLLIYTTNPDYYLDKVKGFKRKIMEGNNRMYGTPLSITSNTLKYNFNDLEKLINDGLALQRETKPNLEQALIDLGYDIGIPDGIVNTHSINTIDSLDVSGLMISDLTGIETFTSISYLNVSSNLLSNANFTQNSLLNSLICSFNQLTILDVSMNTDLAYLDCRSNQISNINVTQNSNLVRLITSQNPLGSLNVSQNVLLTELNCSNNDLTYIDASQNVALTILYCYGNQLTSLNVSNNPSLTTLWCNDNQLTNIDISQNVVLTSLLVYVNQLDTLDLSQNTALIELNCLNNQLTSLDISQNISLVELNCAGNPIGMLDASKNVNLESINCNICNLTCLNVKNGNNMNVTFFAATINPSLTCIEVDDPIYSNSSGIWSLIDQGASFSNNCNNLCTGGVGLENLESSSCVTIYPNPTQRSIQINLNKFKSITKITILNQYGNLMIENEYNANDKVNFNLDASPGVYFLNLEFHSGEIKSYKVLKL